MTIRFAILSCVFRITAGVMLIASLNYPGSILIEAAIIGGCLYARGVLFDIRDNA